MDKKAILAEARHFIRMEAEALAATADMLDDTFVTAVDMLSNCSGIIMTTGSGTSGTIARRLSHVLSTTGSRAFFVHPADALHGPSAAVRPGDILVAFSKAGRSAEINDFAQVTRERGGKVISLTWQPDSPLAERSDLVLTQPAFTQAEGDGIYPMGSTLTAGAICGALCLATKKLHGFDDATLIQTHPSGGVVELIRTQIDK